MRNVEARDIQVVTVRIETRGDKIVKAEINKFLTSFLQLECAKLLLIKIVVRGEKITKISDQLPTFIQVNKHSEVYKF